MASRVGPRSASDATRFTSTTPHAASKSSPTSAEAAQTGTSATTTTTASSTPATKSPQPPKIPGRQPGESPEDRVRRLRAAHEAARKAQTSSLDRAIGGSRRFFDVAHKFTVLGLVGFTAIAGLVSVYSVYDMVTYNKQRRTDFIEAQRKMEDDALATARLAFIKGTATDTQITLVEEANALARETGIFGTGQQRTASVDASTTTTIAPAFPTTSEAAPASAASKQKKSSSSWWPFGGGSSKSDAAETSWSEEDESSGVRATDLARAVEDRKEFLQDKAKAAFERERENQRRGGPLDQVGLPQEEKKAEKKGWW
ncbi:uncharacterized protein N0V96_009545 [Colletotrichum fioriniae]|uniref:uncharacterized protein n=1 Tax=Colletotrichum fioriniae TaxID=710243 RepID=UPI0032DBD0B3|nr:hypothetical protein N0V96_009545 [Colletotrichum fioriniae]